MSLVETSQVTDAALPVATLAQHLRLGADYASSPGEEIRLIGALRSALSTLEAATGKIFLRRTFLQTSHGPIAEGVRLGATPVYAVDTIEIGRRDEAPEAVDLGTFALMADNLAPRVVTLAGFPKLGAQDRLFITMTVGMAEAFGGLADGLQQAVFLQAARAYEGETGLSAAVNLLLVPYKPMRLGGLGV